MRINLLLLFTNLLLVSQGSNADILKDANRLLKMTGTDSRFELVSTDQTKKIIRTYSSIVNMSEAVALPKNIKDSIANCYAEIYSWENFSDGIAKILVENLSQWLLLHYLRFLLQVYEEILLNHLDILLIFQK